MLATLVYAMPVIRPHAPGPGQGRGVDRAGIALGGKGSRSFGPSHAVATAGRIRVAHHRSGAGTSAEVVCAHGLIVAMEGPAWTPRCGWSGHSRGKAVVFEVDTSTAHRSGTSNSE